LFWYEWRHRLRWVIRALGVCVLVIGAHAVWPAMSGPVAALKLKFEKARSDGGGPMVVPASGVTEAERPAMPIQAPRPAVLVFDTAGHDRLPPPRLSSRQRACLADAVHQNAAKDEIAVQIAIAQTIMRRATMSGDAPDVCAASSTAALVGACSGIGCRTDRVGVLRMGAVAVHRRQQAAWIADDVAAGRAWLAEIADATLFGPIGMQSQRDDLIEVGRVGRLILFRAPEDRLPPFFAEVAVELPAQGIDMVALRVPAYVRQVELSEPVPMDVADKSDSAVPVVDTSAQHAPTLATSAWLPSPKAEKPEAVPPPRTASRPTATRRTRTVSEPPAEPQDRTALMKALIPNN
jgi:hypothetical protein